MTLKAHTVQAVVVSIVASQFLPAGELALLFLSIILIDVDHYFDFVMVTGRFGLRDMFRFHHYVWNHRDNLYGMSLFHTVEVFLLLWALGYYSRFFWIILAGFLIHMALDLISLTINRMFFNRAFFITEYLIKRKLTKKCYPVPDEAYWRGFE